MPLKQVLAFLFLCTVVSAKSSPRVCLNGGVLNKDNKCDCLPDYTGNTCEKECPCENGGKCISNYGKCDCPTGYLGKRCETKCPCENGGTCKGKSTNCRCAEGFLGAICQTKCPCQNGGRCKGETTKCNCAKGFVGKECQMACPCKNGRCIGETPECKCSYQFYGKQCEIPCPCKNGGRCESLSLIEASCKTLDNGLKNCPDYNVKCKCKINWTGRLCEEDKCQCQNGGTCMKGRYCMCPPGFAGHKCEIKLKCCTIWGDPHLMTFDGARMDFMGSCRYNLVSFCPCVAVPHGIPSFSVQLKNWRKAETVKKVSWAKKVDVYIDGVQVTLGQKKEVLVKGVKKTLPKKIKHARITRSGKFVRLDTEFGVSVMFNGRARAVVCVPEAWDNHLCGICGNNDGIRDNDYITRQGTDLKMEKNRRARNTAVASSWRMMDHPGEMCTDTIAPEVVPKPSETWEQKAKSHAYCGLIVAKNGPFAKCLAAMPPLKVIEYSQACVFDVAEMAPVEENAKKMACSSLEAFAAECEQLHMSGDDSWREITGCQFQCPEGMIFKKKMSACPATCANSKAPETCTKVETEGCACPEGTLMSGDTCVKPTNCGCMDKAGDYYEPRETYMAEDCKQKYVCQPGNETVSSFIEKQPGCTKEETCKAIEGVEQCVPIPVNGEWSEWEEWSSCTKLCGHDGLVMIRTRACDNPPPKHGGSCHGSSFEVQSCLPEIIAENVDVCQYTSYDNTVIAMENFGDMKMTMSIDECREQCNTATVKCNSFEYNKKLQRCFLSGMTYVDGKDKGLIRTSNDFIMYSCP